MGAFDLTFLIQLDELILTNLLLFSSSLFKALALAFSLRNSAAIRFCSLKELKARPNLLCHLWWYFTCAMALMSCVKSILLNRTLISYFLSLLSFCLFLGWVLFYLLVEGIPHLQLQLLRCNKRLKKMKDFPLKWKDPPSHCDLLLYISCHFFNSGNSH